MKTLKLFYPFLCSVLCNQVSGQETIFIDLSKDTDRQVIVDKEDGQYLGHPTTTLIKNSETVLCVYPKGHGRGAIVYKRSLDGGQSWGERLKTPMTWSSSKEVPTLFQVKDKKGKELSLIHI